MFCNQCEQTAKGTGCTVMGVCGKLAPVADLQDHVIYALRLLSRTALKARAKGVIEQDTDDFTVRALFSTLTNVNFDNAALHAILAEVVAARVALAARAGYVATTGPAAFVAPALGASVAPTGETGVASLAANADINSLMQILLYGLIIGS